MEAFQGAGKSGHLGGLPYTPKKTPHVSLLANVVSLWLSTYSTFTLLSCFAYAVWRRPFSELTEVSPSVVDPQTPSNQAASPSVELPPLPSQSWGLFDPLISVTQSSCAGRRDEVALKGGVGVCMLQLLPAGLPARQKQPISLNP